MAEKQTINIDIQTTADTGGVTKADDALKRLNGTVSISTVDQFLDNSASKARVAEFAFYDLEKEIAKTGNSGEKLTPLVGAIKRVDAAAESGAGGVKNLGGFVNQAGFQVTDFAVQVQGGTSAITAFSQQFPQLIGSVQQSGLELGKIEGGLANLPIGIGTAISIGAVAVGVGVSLAVAAYDKMKAAEKALHDSIKDHAAEQLKYAQRLIDFQNKEREDFILSVYKEQTDELQKQAKALERINELKGAKGNTAQAEADAAITAAQNTGGNVTAAKGNALEVGVQNKINELQSQLQKSEQTADDAALALKKADSLLGEFRSRGDEYSDGFKEAAANQDKARIANDEAQQDIQLQRQKFDEARKQLSANTDASLSNLQKEAQDDLTKSAQDTLAALQQKSAEVGGNLSSNAKAAIQELTQALADGVVKANESRLVTDAINQVKASREGADERIVTALGTLVTAGENFLKRMPDLERRISFLEENSWQ